MLCAIEWDPSPVLFSVGSFAIRYYSLWWIIGLAAAYYILKKLYNAQRLSSKYFDSLVVYAFIGIFVGARLGHFLIMIPSFSLLAHWR